jgi:hypothetical protein
MAEDPLDSAGELSDLLRASDDDMCAHCGLGSRPATDVVVLYGVRCCTHCETPVVDDDVA